MKIVPRPQEDKNSLGGTCRRIFRLTPVFVLGQMQGSTSHGLRKKDKNQVVPLTMTLRYNIC